MSADGSIACVSKFGPKETMDRAAAAVTTRGISIMARIDHAAAAAEVGQELRPTEVLIFGNPRAGTPLMQAVQTIGIDLPLKALIWQDGAGRTWLAYNNPLWLAHRHGVDAGWIGPFALWPMPSPRWRGRQPRNPQSRRSTRRGWNGTCDLNSGGMMNNVRKTSQVRLARRSPGYWRVTFDIPPLNIFGPETIPQLNGIVTALETDEHVRVVVFDSAVEGFFLTHYDFLAKIEDSTSLPPGPTGLQPLPDMLVRVSRAPVVSIAAIRGRATGVGSELALASDMRFASRERAVLSQWEVGAGLVPGGGPMARLPRLIGRGRALEVLLGADDIDGDLAELYGYVNRSLLGTELDDFVDRLAKRIASFDKQAIAEIKSLVNVASLPADSEISPEWEAFIDSLGRPAAQERIKKLMSLGFHRPGDVENRLGHYLGHLSG